MDNDSDFDFEQWSTLAKKEPQRFEELRQQAIDKILHSSPEKLKKRMQGLQWQIDQIRNTSKTPISACIKISSMMWENVLGEEGLVESIEKLSVPQQKEAARKNKKATILKFNKDNDPDKDRSAKK